MEKYITFKIPKVVHRNKSYYDVLIDRTTKWGNPYTRDHEITKEESFLLGDASTVGKIVTRDQCIDLYGMYLANNTELLACLPELEGKYLGCWCKNEDGKGKRCHGDEIVAAFIEHEIHNKLFEY